MDKREIRKNLTEKRNALTKQQVMFYSEKIASQILNSGIYRENKCICIYQAFRNEVSCEPILQHAFQAEKEVFVPVTDQQTKTMEFYQITKHTIWQKGAYGILEPRLENSNSYLQEPALILMPGLAFDRQKHRIGYGGGYYDKYLALHKEHTTMALCYSFQIIEESLPFEEYDILPDYIVTENEFL
ncbi:MAG: 5-formyltetrahydrofolate cyclo-ligase [Lachnospiraceae bacterium]